MHEQAEIYKNFKKPDFQLMGGNSINPDFGSKESPAQFFSETRYVRQVIN